MKAALLLPVLLGLLLLEICIGGARLLYAIPGVALVSLAAVFTAWPGIKTSRRADLPALLAACAFTLYILLRNRFSDIEYIARLQFTIMAGCIMIYLLFALVLTKPADRTRLFVFLIFLALLQLWPALVQFSERNDWMPLPWAQRRGFYSGLHEWRASGFFISPNNFAGYMEAVSLIAMAFVIWGKSSGAIRILTGYAALAGMAGVVISGSRGGYLSLTVGILIVIALSLRVWKKLPSRPLVVAAVTGTAILVILGTGLFAAFHSSVVETRVGQINDPGNMRLLLWRAALDQFRLSPFFGTGGFSYLHYGRLFRDPSVQNDPIHVHNDYLQLLADYGIVGASLFAIMLLLHLRAGFASFRHLVARTSDWDSPLGDRLALNIGCQGALAAYAVHSVVDFNMQLPLNALMMATVFAVLANPGAPREESPEGVRGMWIRYAVRWCLPFLGIGFLIYELPMIGGELYAERSRVALRDGHPETALKLAREGVAKSKDNPDLYFEQGEAALELASASSSPAVAVPLVREAIAAFRSGLSLFPSDSRLMIKLAQALAASGDYFTAGQILVRAELVDPNSSFVAAYRGMVEYNFGHLDDAQLAFERAIELGGESAGISTQGLKLVAQARARLLESEGKKAASTPAEISSDSSKPLPTVPDAVPMPSASPAPAQLPDTSENTQDLLKSRIPDAAPSR
jgi:tetratricopeptide (TPR) repeat protein